MRRAFLLLLPIVQAFVPSGTTMPSADFCRTIGKFVADGYELHNTKGTIIRSHLITSSGKKLRGVLPSEFHYQIN
jgi:hypothetical protein